MEIKTVLENIWKSVQELKQKEEERAREIQIMKEDIKDLKRTAELILQAVTVTKPQGEGPLAEWLKAEIKEMKGVLKNMEEGMKSVFKSVEELKIMEEERERELENMKEEMKDLKRTTEEILKAVTKPQREVIRARNLH